jgi:hypothetical protein
MRMKTILICIVLLFATGALALPSYDKPPAMPPYFEAQYDYRWRDLRNTSSQATGSGKSIGNFEAGNVRASGSSLYSLTGAWQYDILARCHSSPSILHGLTHIARNVTSCRQTPKFLGRLVCSLLGESGLPPLGTLGSAPFNGKECVTYTYDGTPLGDPSTRATLYFFRDEPFGFVLDTADGTTTISITGLQVVKPPASAFSVIPSQCDM